LVDHLDPGTKDKDEEKEDDISGREEWWLKIPDPRRSIAEGRSRAGLDVPKQQVVDPRAAAVKDQQSKDEEAISQEFLLI
jgi:hypothetical protein